MDIWGYVSSSLASLILIMGIHGWVQDGKLDDALGEAERLRAIGVVNELNRVALSSALDEQSKKLRDISIDHNASVVAYEHLLATQKPEIRYKYIKETVYVNVETPREERSCEDIKQIQRNTYNADWNKF